MNDGKNRESGPEITPESTFMNRRLFMKGSIYGASALATTAIYRRFRGSPPPLATPKMDGSEDLTDLEQITHYNNYYEFSTDKEAVALYAPKWKFDDWALEIDGLVENPRKLTLNDIRKIETEERVYRFRCVEGWSMVIPWSGFPLARLIEEAKPTSKASYVAFETYFNERDMPDAKYAGIQLPYREGLRLDEALHPLTLLATGIYKKDLANQNGAPIRLVVPWKYGFKSIKSIVKITLADREPQTTWNIANPREYGFYSNVNPAVDHPRWSQKQERRIGELTLRDTLMFNGYEKEVAPLYAGLDLRANF